MQIQNDKKALQGRHFEKKLSPLVFVINQIGGLQDKAALH